MLHYQYIICTYSMHNSKYIMYIPTHTHKSLCFNPSVTHLTKFSVYDDPNIKNFIEVERGEG